MLCNHAEAQNGILYLSGAGIDRFLIPQNVPGPWGVNLGIGISIKVPWTQTNQAHNLELMLKDGDGQDVLLPSGPDNKVPLKVGTNFNIGRPPFLEIGEPQLINLAMNLPGLPFEKLGTYFFKLFVDGTEMAELSLKVSYAPGLPQGQPQP